MRYIFILLAILSLSGCFSPQEPEVQCKTGNELVDTIGQLELFNKRLVEIGIDYQIRPEEVQCFRYEGIGIDAWVTVMIDSKEMHSIFFKTDQFPGNLKFLSDKESMRAHVKANDALYYGGEAQNIVETEYSDRLITKEVEKLYGKSVFFDEYRSSGLRSINGQSYSLIRVSLDKNQPFIIMYIY